MTPKEMYAQECESITRRTGRYIPPYRMAMLVQTAKKITDMLVKTDVFMTYEECNIVLNIVSDAIKNITKEEIMNA